MNDSLYSITIWHEVISPPPKKKKNGKINQRLTEKMEYIRFYKATTHTPMIVILPFLPHFGE